MIVCIYIERPHAVWYRPRALKMLTSPLAFGEIENMDAGDIPLHVLNAIHIASFQQSDRRSAIYPVGRPSCLDGVNMYRLTDLLPCINSKNASIT